MRCLTAIGQLRYAPFEVVVVTDRHSAQAVRQASISAAIKLLPFDEPNISVARNIGIEHAAGSIVAFIDDDAVPEPGWLTHMAEGFQDPVVGAVAGFVLGRNGVSWQWRAQSVDLAGVAHALDVPVGSPVVLTPSPGRAIKTEGTNMAFRRTVLADAAGFDPNYHYFLDETDLNLRLAARGVATAVVPLAVVHHGFAENQTRRSDRVPKDLTQLGASWAVFMNRHCPEQHRVDRWKTIQSQERHRALRHMVAGLLEPRDVRRLLKSLRSGFEQGLARPAFDARTLSKARSDFLQFPSDPHRRIEVLSGRVWSMKRLLSKAEEIVDDGGIPNVFVFSPSGLFHKRQYTPEGVWLQTGGLFGKSLRIDPVFKLWRFRSRLIREKQLWDRFQ